MQPKKAWWESAMQRGTEARAAQPSYYGCAGCFVLQAQFSILIL